MLIIETQPDKIEEYERKLRLHEDIIRFMTIKIKTLMVKNQKWLRQSKMKIKFNIII